MLFFLNLRALCIHFAGLHPSTLICFDRFCFPTKSALSKVIASSAFLADAALQFHIRVSKTPQATRVGPAQILSLLPSRDAFGMRCWKVLAH